MSMDSQLTSLNPQSPPRRQCGHIPTLRLVEGSSAEVADRVNAVVDLLTTWSGETAVLDNAVSELKAARKQVSRRPECGRPKDDEATRDAKREQLLEWVLPVAEHLWNEVQSGPTLERVAERTQYSRSGLASALKRFGLTWGDVKAMSRR